MTLEEESGEFTPDADLVFRLIGEMLGASLPWARGTVRVQVHGDDHLEHFTQARGRTWRIERSDGMVFTDRRGEFSTTRSPNGRVEQGPSTGLTMSASVQMLRPAHALIWGRPGEDWRLSARVSSAAEGLWRVELEPVEDADRTGHIVVDERTGVLHELVLGPSRQMTLETLETDPGTGPGAEDDLLR